MSEPIAPPSAQTLAQLRAGFAQVPPGAGLPSTSPEEIWAAVHGGAADGEDQAEPDARRRALIDRLHDDPQLALEWRLAAALGPIAADDVQAPPQLEAASPVARPRWGTFSTVAGLALAAAAALVLWFGTTPPDPPRASEPALRAPQGQRLLHTTLAADHPLPRTDFQLHWSSDVPIASSFSLRVTTQDLQPIYEARDLTTTSVRVPAAAIASIPSGTVLLWRVEAIEPDGRRHASEIWELTVE